MKVTVKNESVVTETTSKGNVIYKQSAALDRGENEFPLPFTVTVKNGVPYKRGVYTLDPAAFRVSRFGSLEIDPYGLRLVELAKV